jgi:dTDP-4-amino-4,6-dideoxygalactose transaminase
MGFRSQQRLVHKLQQDISQSFDVEHVFFTSSGKAALSLLLSALSELRPGKNQVVIPAFNCYSVPSAIAHAKLQAIPCEIIPDSLQFNLDSLKKIIAKSDNILAVIPTYFFGLPSNIDEIKLLLHDKKDIFLIEDAAQSMGGSMNNKFMGTNSDAAIFSLGRGKALSAGEGGILLITRSDIAEIIQRKWSSLPDYSSFKTIKLVFQSILMFFFLNPSLFWIPKLFPSLKLGTTVYDLNFPICKLSSFQAGLLHNWKKRLNRHMKARSRIVSEYLQKLATTAGIAFFTKDPGTIPPSIRFPIMIEKTHHVDRIIQLSEIHGLGIQKSYPHAINHIISSPDTFPSAEKICEHLLTLPCHELVTSKDIQKIVKILHSVTTQN